MARIFDHLEMLIVLANSSRAGEIHVSTESLAPKVGVSQQTVSRKIREMESLGLISREIIATGQKISILKPARLFLEQVHETIGGILDSRPATISFSGRLSKGSGEGAHYMGKKHYISQFSKSLEFTPYPGTLNIMLESAISLKEKRKIDPKDAVDISGFQTGERTYGNIRCYPCRIQGMFKGAIVIPERTHHDFNVVELIAPVCLREKLSLNDGDIVSVEVII